MIVDDEYVLIGSANINQRSLDGSRDTEIAMGAYQPSYTWSGKKTHPHGQVAGISNSFVAYCFKTYAFMSQYSSVATTILDTQVYGYRMSLWAEHLGTLEDSFCQPESLECIRQVNSIAKNNWQIYAADENKEMTGHLMQYPIQVSKNGNVSTLPGHECFPDVGGKVLGSPTNLPDALTT